MSVIKNASYYILFNNREASIHKAVIYDMDGNPLREILLLLSEYYYSSCPRIERMMDPSCVGKARPAKIVIGHHAEFGRTIYYYDKNNNLIASQSYDGPLDLGGLVHHQLRGKNHESSIKVDYDWMLTNNVPVVDSYSGRNWCSLL